MTNPFSGIISSDFKQLFVDAISALMYDDSCTLPCTLYYGVTRYEDCINCWESGTLIQTPSGFKKIEDLIVGDSIYSSQNNINIIEDIRARYYNGVMYRLSTWSSSLPQRVTACHKFPVVKNMKSLFTQDQWYDKDFVIDVSDKVEEIEAKDITLDDALVIPVNECSNVDLNTWNGITINDDILYMLGWWIAEGCIKKDRYPRSGSFCLCASKEEAVARKIQNILSEYFSLNSSLEFRHDADNLLVNWNSSYLAKILLEFGHRSENKHIPNSLFSNLSLRQKEIILNAYVSGDGNVFTKINAGVFNKYSIATTSQILALQIYNILLSLGYFPSINWRDKYIDKNNQQHQMSFHVIWQKDRLQQKSNVRKSNMGLLAKMRKIEMAEDISYVYNLQVKNEHKYIANGLWTNNCVYDAVGKKSANRFQSGGPVPFNNGGICPMCGGQGKRAIEETEDINLMVIWDYKDFINAGTVNDPIGTVQTITFIENTPKLKRAKEIIIANDISNYARHRYERIKEPQPCGLGDTDFIECVWKRSG